MRHRAGDLAINDCDRAFPIPGRGSAEGPGGDVHHHHAAVGKGTGSSRQSQGRFWFQCWPEGVNANASFAVNFCDSTRASVTFI